MGEAMAEAAQKASVGDTAVGDLLIARGKLDRAAFERAMRAQVESGERLDRVLTRLGLVGERDMAEALAQHLDLPLATPEDYPAAPVAEEQISVTFLKESQVLPISTDGTSITLAMADPLDRFAVDALAMRLGCPVRPCVGVAADIENALERLYGGGKSSIAQIAETVDHADPDSTDADVARLRDLASEAPVIRIVNLLIAKAVEARASDIHIEPFEVRLRVRYRIDGTLREIDAPPPRLRAAIISRIKIMANLNIAEHRLPQDGRIRVVVRGKEIDLRVSTLPNLHGEAVVLRVLDRDGVVLDFSALGLDEPTQATLLRLLARPNGILLVTGPTGSGKTTTLYTSLMHLNSPDKKILTVEDPVEYQLLGVNQIQVRPNIGLTFAHALRSILRQDPDIIMIGEIRDLETAQIAVQAALTGHLVLATLHTNAAAATVTRLLDMGVEDYLLTSTVIGVVAQRLVRKLCLSCREVYQPLPEMTAQLGRFAQDGSEPVTFYRPTGCAKCGGSGYFGRIGILEILPTTDEVRRLVLKHAEAGEIHRAAVVAGMRSMYEDGMSKARQGVTSLEEVVRVTSDR